MRWEKSLAELVYCCVIGKYKRDFFAKSTRSWSRLLTPLTIPLDSFSFRTFLSNLCSKQFQGCRFVWAKFQSKLKNSNLEAPQNEFRSFTPNFFLSRLISVGTMRPFVLEFTELFYKVHRKVSSKPPSAVVTLRSTDIAMYNYDLHKLHMFEWSFIDSISVSTQCTHRELGWC